MNARVRLVSYLLTPWSRVLEKLIGLQLVKKFPAFYGTRKFITALTNARHVSLSWASSIQSTHPHPISRRSVSRGINSFIRNMICFYITLCHCVRICSFSGNFMFQLGCTHFESRSDCWLPWLRVSFFYVLLPGCKRASKRKRWKSPPSLPFTC
jgi:hypothetical protein